MKIILTCSLILFATVLKSTAQAEPTVEAQYTIAVETLKADTKVQIALNHVLALEADSQAVLVELTEIEAPPFKEAKRGIRFSEMLREAGLTDVRTDEVGNVIGRRPGSIGKRVVVYSAHLDTVFPEGTDVTVRYKGERMYAPGIGDNTRGLVNALAVLKAMEFAKIETEADVWFVGNVGEEGLGDLRGIKHLFRDDAQQIDSLIAIDGGSSSRIVYGGVGSHRYRVTFKGPGGHSWGAFGLANPHHALGRAIAIFDENAPNVTNYGEKTSYNVGRIGGGTSINSIPFESWAEIDLRSVLQVKLDEIDKILQSAVKQALREENEGRSAGEELTVEVVRVGKRPAAPGDATQPLVQRAMAVTQVFGIQPKLRTSSTDANLPISMGIPAITMSRGGRGGNAHSPDEWWQNYEGHVGIQIGMMTLLIEAGYVF